MVLSAAGGRGSAEDELVRRETWAFIGLEHVVGPAIRSCQGEIRVQVPAGVVDKLELRVSGTSAAARDAGRAIHQAVPGCWAVIALRDPGSMRVAQIVGVRQRNRARLNHAAGRSLVQPVAGLDVVLRRCWRGAANAGRGAETLKKVIRRAVFLKDYNDVLKVGGSCQDLGISDVRAQPKQQEKTLHKEFHRFVLRAELKDGLAY